MSDPYDLDALQRALSSRDLFDRSPDQCEMRSLRGRTRISVEMVVERVASGGENADEAILRWASKHIDDGAHIAPEAFALIIQHLDDSSKFAPVMHRYALSEYGVDHACWDSFARSARLGNAFRGLAAPGDRELARLARSHVVIRHDGTTLAEYIDEAYRQLGPFRTLLDRLDAAHAALMAARQSASAQA